MILCENIRFFSDPLDREKMSANIVLQSKPRRSRSTTPLIPNGILDTPRHSQSEHSLSSLHAPHKEALDGTPVIGGRQVDASFRDEDKVSPMLAKLRMTPGINHSSR